MEYFSNGNFLTVPFFHLSFIPISRPSPPFIQLEVWGSAVSSSSGSGRSPAAKWNFVNSGPRNERFLHVKVANYSVL